MRTVLLFSAACIAVAYAQLEVKDLTKSYVRVSGSDVDVCDSGLSLTASDNNTIAAANVKFRDADTTCTNGSLTFSNEIPDTQPELKLALKDVPLKNVLFSSTTISCTKKGQTFTLNAVAVQPLKSTKFQNFDLESDRVSVVFTRNLEKPCVYLESSLGICFPATGQVKLANGAMKAMNQLRLNDEVHVGGGRTSRVFMFTHNDADTAARFTKLTTASGHAVTLTPSHHLYVNGKLTATRNVRVGDTLELDDGSISPVVDVRAVVARGLYNPQTMHGDVIVDGIRASTYTETVYPGVAHALLAPFRLAYQYARTTCSAFESGAPDFRAMLRYY